MDASPLFLAPPASVLILLVVGAGFTDNLYDVRLITLNKNLDPSPPPRVPASVVSTRPLAFQTAETRFLRETGFLILV
jgi:hypothetical protein